MRKSFVYAAGLMCLALSITNCQKEPVDQATPASEPNFELFARPVTTKTVNDGLDTKWAAGDDINVFHAVAGTTTYVSDNQFTVQDTESGRFDGTIETLDADKSYDWYAFYPYSEHIETPDNTASGWCYIGSRSDASQTQTGDNNMSHIAGSNYPLYGIAKGVKATDVPSIQMQHLTSVIKVVVKNSTEEEFSLNSVSFTAGEDISGQFYIAFDSETPKYTPTKYASETAKLTISDVKVAANAKATLYMAIKPFTAKSGSTIKLTVNGYEKTVTLDKDITFTAGHIKPLNFNYDTKLVWALVPDANSLSVGDKLVIASNAKGKIASALSDDYLTEESATFSSDNSTIEALPSSALIFTLGGTSGKWTLANGSGTLLGATAVKKVAFGKGTTTWSISITDGGTATIQNGTSDNGRLLHNVNSTRFTTYKSDATVSMLLPQIYRLESVLPTLTKPTIIAEINSTKDGIDVVWSDVENATKYVVSCTGQENVEVASGVEIASFTGLTIGQEYTFTVTATADGYKSATSDEAKVTIPDPRTPLTTPVVEAEVQDINSVYALWSEIDGAKDYTITCGEQIVTVMGTEHTFTNLAYSTEYTVSVVANPSDETVNTKSSAGKSETIKTGANPSAEPITVTLGSDWNSLFGTSYTGNINSVKANSLSLTGKSGDVSISVANGTSTNGYVKKNDFRAYNGYSIVLSVPSGKNITAISTTKGGKEFSEGISASVGKDSISSNSYTWNGSSQSVTLSISKTVSFATIVVTYE